MGLATSYFYNPHLAPSITRQSKSSIASAILLFESFLGNNINLGSLDEMIEYIHHIINEPRQYRDEDLLDTPISIECAWFQVMSSCGFSGYIPTVEDMDIIWNILTSLSQEDINRIYYKNNLYAFCNNQSIQRAIITILEKLEVPFLDPNECPAVIRVELNEFKNILKEYVYYGHMYQDKIEKVAVSFKRVSVLTDTDSSMITLDAWYHYVLNLVIDKPLKIKTQYVDEVELMETGKVKVSETEKPEMDYDFYRDEFIEMKQAVKKNQIIPQNNLRYSIINIMLYIVTELSTDYMRIYSGNYNSYSDERCVLKLKNELLMKRILLMMNARKHYAYFLEMQQSHIVPIEASCGITGMEMDKATLQKSVRERLKSILYNDVLAVDTIDQRQVLVDIIKFEKEIYETLMSGDTKYYKPVAIKSLDNYKDPGTQHGIKAAMVYNATKDPEMPSLNLNERNSIYEIKVKIDPINIEPLKDTNPRVYDALNHLFNDKETKEIFSKGINAYGIPQDTPVPKWILDYIDFYQIINDNIKNFPMDSIGLVGRAGNDNINHSNVLQII